MKCGSKKMASAWKKLAVYSGSCKSGLPSLYSWRTLPTYQLVVRDDANIRAPATVMQCWLWQNEVRVKVERYRLDEVVRSPTITDNAAKLRIGKYMQRQFSVSVLWRGVRASKPAVPWWKCWILGTSCGIDWSKTSNPRMMICIPFLKAISSTTSSPIITKLVSNVLRTFVMARIIVLVWYSALFDSARFKKMEKPILKVSADKSSNRPPCRMLLSSMNIGYRREVICRDGKCAMRKAQCAPSAHVHWTMRKARAGCAHENWPFVNVINNQ